MQSKNFDKLVQLWVGFTREPSLYFKFFLSQGPIITIISKIIHLGSELIGLIRVYVNLKVQSTKLSTHEIFEVF